MRTLIASALAGLALLLIPANSATAAPAPAETAKVQVDQKVSHKAGSDMQDCYCRRTYRVRYYRVRYVPVRYYRVRYSVRYWVVYR